ncbi:unnamed protein product [Linum tenue]|uniref:Uncharacterized protein n=1 Tax=Linum tenue TaxID=586396 RepID=A0AAV0RPA6_9ROSI|nr:unnamed protein product [Linum tenue]
MFAAYYGLEIVNFEMLLVLNMKKMFHCIGNWLFKLLIVHFVGLHAESRRHCIQIFARSLPDKEHIGVRPFGSEEQKHAVLPYIFPKGRNRQGIGEGFQGIKRCASQYNAGGKPRRCAEENGGATVAKGTAKCGETGAYYF